MVHEITAERPELVDGLPDPQRCVAIAGRVLDPQVERVEELPARRRVKHVQLPVEADRVKPPDALKDLVPQRREIIAGLLGGAFELRREFEVRLRIWLRHSKQPVRATPSTESLGRDWQRAQVWRRSQRLG